jgi:hypothetical protein
MRSPIGIARRALGLPLLLLVAAVNAQSTRVSGRITDATTGEPLPFVNISFVDSRIGTTSDITGHYSIETYYATDSLRVSFVGFMPRSVAVRKDRAQVIDIAMQPSNVQLAEVVIRPPDENPAFAVLRRVIAHKPANNREKLAAYEYQAYNKIEFDLNNITEEFTQKKLFKPFAFIFDNIDSTGAKPYLPIFMTETLSEVYYRQKPKTQRELIKGTKVSGIENESVSQFMGDMYQNINIYDNFLVIFGRNFVSPIADGGKGFYDYYLTDSAFVGKYWCYKLEFKPKRPQELAFAGEMWINDTTYAVRRIEAGIPAGANLNFVQGFWVRQEYDQVQNEVWMLTRDELVADLNVIRDTGKPNTNAVQGFYGRRTASYRDFVVNRPREEAFYTGAEEVLMALDPASEQEAYWEQNRHMALSEKEARIYHMVDTMKTIPRFRTYIDIVQTVVTGYYPMGDIELGPYFTTYSFNAVEGNRFRMGARTSSQWSKRVELEGYTAYGTKDEEFKFGFGGKFMVSRSPRIIAGAYFKRDIEQLGQSVGAFREDNILSSLFRRLPNDKLTLVDDYYTFLEREWFMGFSNTIAFRHRTMFPRGSLSYVTYTDAQEPEVINSITTTEVMLNTYFAYKEKYVSGDFSRVSLGTPYPVLQVHLVHGFKGVLDGDYDYTKMIVRVQQRIQLGALGFLRYTVTGGKVWGTLPYPLLLINAGNETFYYDDIAFNTMNFFEFINDRSATLFLEHHFDGLFFNRVPLFRRLKWREVVGFKTAVGSLDPKQREEMELLPFMYDLSEGPFAELSLGVENILKILRVDAVRRLTYLDHPNTKAWALRLKLNITF